MVLFEAVIAVVQGYQALNVFGLNTGSLVDFLVAGGVALWAYGKHNANVVAKAKA